MIVDMFSTLVDFQPYPSIILFLPDCNLRCPYCYNHEIVTKKPSRTISFEEADEIITKYRKLIDGLVISGGEPLLHQDEEFINFIKKQCDKRLKIKIDSNLTIPVSPTLLNCLYGISFTIKPLDYYKQQHIETILSNLLVLSDLPWKEARITTVKDTQLQESLRLFLPYLDEWKINVHNAVVPETGVLNPDLVEFFNTAEEFYDFVEQYFRPLTSQLEIVHV